MVLKAIKNSLPKELSEKTFLSKKKFYEKKTNLDKNIFLEIFQSSEIF